MERLQDPYIVLTLWFNLALQSDRDRQLRRIRVRRKNSIKRVLKAIGWMWLGFV